MPGPVSYTHLGETRTVNIRGQLLEIGGVDDPTVFTPNRFVRRIPRQWERQLAACRDGRAGERYSILLTHRPELTRYYPVSYTHLDVYKRQGLKCRRPKSKGNPRLAMINSDRKKLKPWAAMVARAAPAAPM